MASAREQLRALVASDDPFGQPGEVTRELQLEAAREAFAAHRERVPLLRTRATETGVREITGFDDLVPLLFSHTSYKSYPLSLITGGRWDRLLRWYTTVSAVEPGDVDIEGVRDIDEWTERVTAAGHRPVHHQRHLRKGVLPQLRRHRPEFPARHPGTPHLLARPAPAEAHPPRLPACTGERPDAVHRRLPLARGRLRQARRDPAAHRGAAQGVRTDEQRTAAPPDGGGHRDPQEISSFESASETREGELGTAVARIVDDIAAHRDEPLLIAGMNNQQFTLIQALRARGVPDGSLHPDTLVLSGGGNKGSALPDDYQQQFAAFYDGVRRVRSYGMTEMQGSCPACEKGNHHVPPWVIPLVLDEPGETLLNAEHGVVAGRFAFLDVSLEGRWGGLISGDRVFVDFSPCDCGRAGPASCPTSGATATSAATTRSPAPRHSTPMCGG